MVSRVGTSLLDWWSGRKTGLGWRGGKWAVFSDAFPPGWDSSSSWSVDLGFL